MKLVVLSRDIFVRFFFTTTQAGDENYCRGERLIKAVAVAHVIEFPVGLLVCAS